MRAGLYKEPIIILETQILTNDYGEETVTWITKTSTRARLVHDGGQRLIENEEVFYSNNKTFQVHYYVDVDEFDRIKWDNKIYRILNIEPDTDKQIKTIKAELVND